MTQVKLNWSFTNEGLGVPQTKLPIFIVPGWPATQSLLLNFDLLEVDPGNSERLRQVYSF